PEGQAPFLSDVLQHRRRQLRLRLKPYLVGHLALHSSGGIRRAKPDVRQEKPHSTQFSGKASTPSRIDLKWASITLILRHQRPRPFDVRVTMRTTDRQTRENRTITIDFQNEATYVQLLGDGKAFVECVLAFLLALGFQLKHKATCRGGGCLTRHSHYVR